MCSFYQTPPSCPPQTFEASCKPQGVTYASDQLARLEVSVNFSLGSLNLQDWLTDLREALSFDDQFVK